MSKMMNAEEMDEFFKTSIEKEKELNDKIDKLQKALEIANEAIELALESNQLNSGDDKSLKEAKQQIRKILK